MNRSTAVAKRAAAAAGDPPPSQHRASAVLFRSQSARGDPALPQKQTYVAMPGVRGRGRKRVYHNNPNYLCWCTCGLV